MAEATITEFSVSDLPCTARSGTPKKRILCSVRYTPAGATDTITVANYITGGVALLEGVLWDTVSGARTGTTLTWNAGTGTITTSGGAAAAASTCGFIVQLT